MATVRTNLFAIERELDTWFITELAQYLTLTGDGIAYVEVTDKYNVKAGQLEEVINRLGAQNLINSAEVDVLLYKYPKQ